jgi:hypothetical protein
MIYLIDIYVYMIYTDDAFNRVTQFGKDIGKTIYIYIYIYIYSYFYV